ncbi:probable LRR receptor-like serine/threonine-protein kinase At3g47570 isoform X3 [Salvia miltiorrhiza]|uniref:probable LRR receptor-like serine/threonine-protein kinase At3g47570 isoform X3 n=1 Tax=Salvia miltiorrhiza TaxID=226208 RepID=UPI0025ABFAD1|nr:probable LRR receptor-like serine/threonine-protein kinase At3g47570 isoform X3 [Salvia miltiorrhiza]
MEAFSFFFSLAFMLLTLNSVTLIATSLPFSNSTTDQDALLAFKNAITSHPNSILISNWSTNAPICSWTGVSCSLDHQRVTALNLSGFGLQGTLSPHLGNLTFLRSLDMSSNNFTGSIPSELSNIRGLRTLNLSSNQLTGTPPSCVFTNMSVLVEIDLRSNELTGQLPSDICSNTPKLKRLFLRNNQINGKIPKSIYKCREMEELSLAYNQFNGNIPTEIGNLTKLTYLGLSSNHVEGEVPSSIFNISSLEFVYLGGNSLSGSIPLFKGVTKLQLLYLDFNKLTGGIPKEIGHLTSLKYLALQNNSLTGHVPKQIGNLTLLKNLRIDSNNLAGSIPASIFNISTLEILNLQQNQFSGRLPPNMCVSLVNLQELYLHTNRLSGEIPTCINNASKLTFLELNSNSFTGSIPDFGNLRQLQALRLWENNFTGAEFLSSLTNCRNLETLEISNNPQMNGILPASIGNLSTSLVTFSASSCGIRGAIPSEIGNLSSLQTLELSGNQFTGFIPTTVGKLKQLVKLQFYGSQLQGYIPRELCNISTLGYLFLSVNMLTGSVPECLGEIKSLKEVSLASNKLNSTLPSNLLNIQDLLFLNLSLNYLSGELPYQMRMRAIYFLDLSSNKFSGNIPSSIGDCKSLEYLILSNNKLNGSIPKSLGELGGLQTLNLSNNNLSGLIPKSLENLKLKQFDVSCNQLEGEIPNEGCFADFSAQSFLNNSGLCGPERFQVPSCKTDHPRSTSKTVSLVMKYVVPPLLGFMLVVIGILILLRRWRPQEKPPTSANSSVTSSWKIVSEKELELGTSSFSETNLLGRGGIGSVFKATLADGTLVAVKVFNLQVEGATKIFDTESRILGTIRHRNLVKTIGCCSNTGFKALILAYMPNGSLDEWLHSDKLCLDLVERLKIAIDVAFALEYLHHGHTFPIAHCDIKPSNVLLDADMTAHVGDFGISKLFDNGEAAVHTVTMATIGYAAPEFGSEGMISTSGDVYSYGILLLEIFTSKRPTNDMFGAEMSIKEWVGKALQEDRISEIVAPALLSTEDPHFCAKEQCVLSIFDLAMKCLAFLPEERINMMEVVAALQKIKDKFAVEEIKKKHHK